MILYTITEENLTTLPSDVEPNGDADGALYGNKSPVLLSSYYVACILGLPGNIMTVIVIMTSKLLRRKPINIILVHQAVIDIMVLIATSIEEIMGQVENNFMTAPFVCHYINSKSMSGTCMYVSTYNMLLLSIERYYAIIDPLKYDAEKLLRRLPFYFSFVWCLCIGLLCIVPATSIVKFGICLNAWKMLTTNWWEFYSPYEIVVGIVIPLLITIFCYSRMFYALQKSSHATNTDKTSKESSNIHKLRMAQMNIFKTCLTMVVIFVVCWSIPELAIFLLSIRYYTALNNYHFYIGRLAVVLNSGLNPFIYSIRYDDFKQQLFRLFRKKT